VSAPGRQWFLAVPGRLGLGLGGRLQGEPLGGSAPGGDVPGGTAEIGLAALQQLQPDLAAGGEGRNGLPQQLDRRLADDRDGRRLQPFGNVGAGEGRADDYSPVLVDDDPRGSRRADPVEGSAAVPELGTSYARASAPWSRAAFRVSPTAATWGR